jgi:hypothetical protein
MRTRLTVQVQGRFQLVRFELCEFETNIYLNSTDLVPLKYTSLQ